MFGEVDISALDRVLMDVFNFLFHHVFVLDYLRVTSLLPELEFLINFVALFEVLELRGAWFGSSLLSSYR